MDFQKVIKTKPFPDVFFIFFKFSFCFKHVRLEPEVAYLSFFLGALYAYTTLGKWRIKHNNNE